MANKSVLIRVPATVGSFGGAVDCAALALEAALNVKVTPRLDGRVGIRYFGENGERVPRDRANLVVRAMEAALHLKALEFTGADLQVYSSVPVAVGLGSSTAAVLAGLIAADRLFRLELDEKALFDLAAIYENRSDNLGAACFGGLVTCPEGKPRIYQRTVVPGEFFLDVVVPEVSRTTAVNAVVGKYATEQACEKKASAHFQRAASLTNLFAANRRGNTVELNGSLLPSWPKDVPGLEEALHVRTPGLLGVFVCGSGPAVGVLAESDLGTAVEAVQKCFAKHGIASCAARFRASNTGAWDWNAVRADILPPQIRALRPGLEKSPLMTA